MSAAEKPMKISELIAMLEEVKKEEGDLPIFSDASPYDQPGNAIAPAEVGISVTDDAPGTQDGAGVIINVAEMGTYDLMTSI